MGTVRLNLATLPLSRVYYYGKTIVFVLAVPNFRFSDLDFFCGIRRQ